MRNPTLLTPLLLFAACGPTDIDSEASQEAGRARPKEVLCGLFECDGAGNGGLVDAGAGNGGRADGGSHDTGADAPSFATLDALLRDKVSSGAINGYAVQIYDGDDTLLFESEAGVCSTPNMCPNGSPRFTTELVTGVASSSKWVTSSVVLAALDERVAARTIPSVAAGLDTTVGAVLSRACGSRRLGRGATVTLRQLLSFTSGLLPDASCVGDRSFTMQQCACRILSDSAAVEVASANAGSAAGNAQPPGSVWKYGPSYQVVAAAMVEVMTGQSFASLYQRLVRGPTGMSANYQNPTEISGSLRASVTDYARYVRAIYHSGAPGELLSAEALAEQERSQFPQGVVRRSQLQAGLEYGLNTWRWCYRNMDAATVLAFGQNPERFSADDSGDFQDSSCTEIHQQGHGGKGGYQPFVDRPRGFYGVFAMREPSAGGGDQYSASEQSLTAFVRLYAGLVVEELHAR
jgi:CubicO group peptidase (beta-lactamase class C family)